jgi:hypothetical protein
MLDVQRLFFGHSGLTHAVESALGSGQKSRIVGPRAQAGSKAGDSEGGVEREAGFDGELGFLQSTKLRQSGGQRKVRM